MPKHKRFVLRCKVETPTRDGDVLKRDEWELFSHRKRDFTKGRVEVDEDGDALLMEADGRSVRVHLL